MRVAHYNDRSTNFLSYARWFAGRPLARKAIIQTDAPGFTLTVAQSGRSFVVLIKHGRKAVGAVLMNRLQSPLHQEAFGFVVEPHSYVVKAYRGQRLVEGVYRWALANGIVFCSSSNQSSASNGLWRKLSADHCCVLVNRPKARLLAAGEKIDSPNVRLLLSAQPIAGLGER